MKETLRQGKGWGVQSTLAAPQHGLLPAPPAVSSGHPFPGHGRVWGAEHLNSTQLCSLLAKRGVHPSGDSSPNPPAPPKAAQTRAVLAGTGQGQHRVKHRHPGASSEAKGPPLSCEALGPWILLLPHLFKAEGSGPGCGLFSWHSRCLPSVVS